jgi:formylglycine-generating enzyme required for sulfatase activity
MYFPFLLSLTLIVSSEVHAADKRPKAESPSLEQAAAKKQEERMVAIVGNNFAIGKYAVTFEEWDACVTGGGCNGYRPDDNGWGRGNRPVINVSWKDAQTYVKWLSQKTGQTYRLPSEREWEIAARGGTTTDYYWGSDLGKNNANCSGCGSQWDKKQTAPVGSFKPNPFGLYDMLGNVWQWMDDACAGGCAVGHALRGGSWFTLPQSMRAAARFESDAARRNYHYGFRLARTLP